ncbi:MAG: FAD binding domain-containing protein [Acidimicrobiales bacterium]
MTSVRSYRRPQSLEEAFGFAERHGAVVMGGGTRVNAGLVALRTGAGQSGAGGVEVVDLQALDLAGIERSDEAVLRIGAMTRLQQLVESDDVPAVVRLAARHEFPSTLRAQATIGGSIASGDPDSELLATLLVHDGRVHVAQRSGSLEFPLDELLAELPLASGRIITAVTISTLGVSSLMRTGRTPADRPIVAVAVREFDGRRWAAFTGVASTPVLVNYAAGGNEPPSSGCGKAAGDPDVTGRFEPIGDFRGSSDYRRALAGILYARATEAILR